MRLIGPAGEQLNIVSLAQAREMAERAGMDLVLVSDRAVPPVVRIMDYGKLLFEQKKSIKEQKKNNAAQKLKEVKFHVNVDNHDYELKTKKSIEFLEKGCKLKVTLAMRGREIAHKELAFDVINRVMEDLKGKGEPDGEPKIMGKSITVVYSPLRKSGKTAEAGRHLPPRKNNDADNDGEESLSADN